MSHLETNNNAAGFDETTVSHTELAENYGVDDLPLDKFPLTYHG